MLLRQTLLALSSISLPFSWALAVTKEHEASSHPTTKRQLPPGPLFLKAPQLDLRFQPAMDFDKDSCYNTPAMGPNGDLAQGLPAKGLPVAAHCRNEEMLERANVYSRQRCNNGYCAIMYAYYFQKDQSSIATGHRHDWEHVVVWVRMSDWFVSHVSASQHKGYEIKANHEITWTSQGDGKPAIVYHKDGGLTHAFRFASEQDVRQPENHWGRMIVGPLIGHYGWETEAQRTRMYTNDWKHWEAAQLGITDVNFAGNLGRALPGGLAFDVNQDDPNTNNI